MSRIDVENLKTEKSPVKYKTPDANSYQSSNLRHKPYPQTGVEIEVFSVNHTFYRNYDATKQLTSFMHESNISRHGNVIDGQSLLGLRNGRKCRMKRDIKTPNPAVYKNMETILSDNIAIRKRHLNITKDGMLNPRLSEVTFVQTHKDYPFRHDRNDYLQYPDYVYGDKMDSIVEHQKFKTINDPNSMFGALEVYGSDKEEVNRMFIGNETNLLTYVAAFTIGFIIVVVCLCLVSYLRYTLSKFNFYSDRYFQGVEVNSSEDESSMGLGRQNLAERHSKNPNLTKIENYVDGAKRRFSENKIYEDKEPFNCITKYTEKQDTDNIIDTLFNKIEHTE